MLATKTFCVEWGPGCGGSSQVVSIFALIWRSEFESCRSVQFIFRKLFEKNENKWSIKTFCVERLASLKQDPMVIVWVPLHAILKKTNGKKQEMNSLRFTKKWVHLTSSRCTWCNKNALDVIRMHLTSSRCTWCHQNALDVIRMYLTSSICTWCHQNDLTSSSCTLCDQNAPDVIKMYLMFLQLGAQLHSRQCRRHRAALGTRAFPRSNL